MQSLKVRRIEAERVELRAGLWKSTGIDPAFVDTVVAEIYRTFHNTRQAMRNGPKPLRMFGSHHERAVKRFREDTIRWLVEKYAKKNLRNVGLCRQAFVVAMNEKVGQEGFSVAVIEDIIRNLVQKKREILIGEFMLRAQQLLPRLAKTKPRSSLIKRIVHENCLVLDHCLHVEEYADATNLRAEDFEDLLPLGAIDKLSRIVLRKSDPSSIQKSIAEQSPWRVLCGKCIEFHGSPIIAATFDDRKVILEYRTHEQALRVAQALIKRVPSPAPSLRAFLPRFRSCGWMGAQLCPNVCRCRPLAAAQYV